MLNKTVFLLGVFDMIHAGHVALIERAADFGDLYVGVVVDEAVKKQKGIGRPIISTDQRRYIIDNLKQVKGTMLIQDFMIPQFVLDHCDLVIIGADQTHIKNLDQIPKEKRVNLPRTEGVSSSDIIRKIKES